MSAIKDMLLKLQLSLVNYRGQCYDGASNMMGHKSFSVKDATKNCKLLSDTMDTKKERTGFPPLTSPGKRIYQPQHKQKT